MNLLPSINSLQLCHCYGKSSQAPITKLPPELVLYIGDFLISTERTRLRDAWSIDFKCYQQLCDPMDHLTKDDLKPFFEMAQRGDIPLGSTDHEVMDLEDRVDTHLGDDMDIWNDEHYRRGHRWEERVGMKGAARRGVFTANENIIKKHFGLEVWVSHVRTLDWPEDNFWDVIELFPAETTVAWLKLPGAREVFRSPNLTKYERDDKSFWIENGLGMQVQMPRPLSQSARARFKRMMKILDLQPYIHPTQDITLTADEDSCNESEESDMGCAYSGRGTGQIGVGEPQLTMLVRSITRSDEED